MQNDQALLGVMSLDGNQLALPLSAIKSIESMEDLLISEGDKLIEFNGHEYEMGHLSSSNEAVEKRRLAIILNGAKHCLAVDEFESKKLDLKSVKDIPNVMLNQHSFITKLYHEQETKELIFLMDFPRLCGFLEVDDE